MNKNQILKKLTHSESLKELFGEVENPITENCKKDLFKAECSERKSDIEEVVDDKSQPEDEWEVEDDDLLMLEFTKRESQIEEGDYQAKVSKVSAEETTGQYGNYIQVTILFSIEKADGKVVLIPFKASSNLNPKGRLYPAIEALLGSKPPQKFNLRQLEGRSGKVTVSHNEDLYGNIWDNITNISA